MRMMVFFDLPVETADDRRYYRQFHKMLIKSGFIMIQESVYCKLLTTPTVEQSVKNTINKSKPPKGVVQLLTITEKQFSKMDFIIGESHSDIIDSDKRLVIL